MKKLLLGLGTVSLAILPVAAMVSCSATGPSRDLSPQKFVTNVTTKGSKAIEQNVIDPAFNSNAQEILINKINSLTKDMLQMDFDFILTDFYDTYEFENNFAEIELIDKGIEVLSIEGTADLAGTTRTAKLKVSYELELESNQRDDSKVLTKEIDWVIRPVFSSEAEIAKITKLIDGSTTSTEGIDLSDLKEYFLGENDDDQDFDDLGVFDRIRALNKKDNLNNMGGLMGYELKLSDIFSQIAPKAVIDKDTSFFAPSASLGNTFVYPSTTGKLQYNLDIDKLATIDMATITAMTTPADLGKILKTSATNTAMIASGDIKDITITEVGPLLKLTVNFTNAETLSEVISINPALLKVTITPPIK